METFNLDTLFLQPEDFIFGQNTVVFEVRVRTVAKRYYTIISKFVHHPILLSYWILGKVGSLGDQDTY